MRAELVALEGELRALERRRGRERASLQARIDVLAEHAAGEAQRADRLREIIRSLEAELASVRAELEAVGKRRRIAETQSAHRERALALQSAELERQIEVVTALRIGMANVHADIERVASSRAWRVGHGLALAADRLRWRRRVTEGAVAGALARLSTLERSVAALEAHTGDGAAAAEAADAAGLDAAGREHLGRQIRSRLGPPPRRRRWPMVSIIVLNRNGEAHLRRLLSGLQEHTDYPRFELIVVDNASTDGSRSYLREAKVPFPVTLTENEHNASFVEGNWQGAQVAAAELLLFLNNDIEPFERGWLRELVALAKRPGVGAAGATLMHAAELAGGLPLVQHRGIRIRVERDRLRPYNLDDGGTLFSERFGIDVDAPATTGASLMITAARFVAIGGFADGYLFGTEDVDLGLRLIASGERVITSGRAHLLHRESSTQNREGRAFMRENRLRNQRLFAERWDSRLRRECRLSHLRADQYWTDGMRPHIALTLTSLDQSDGYGDWHTGHELGEVLGRLGWHVSYVQRRHDAWYTLPDGVDYLLVLLDAYDVRNVSDDVVKIAWIRNWTERWVERDWFGGYDLVLTSSRASGELIERRTGIQTHVFPLATNLERFRPVPSEPELAADFAFTGNYWNRERAIQGIQPRPQETLKVYGSGWDRVPQLAAYAHGPVPYERLAAVYCSTKIVVDDAAEHTLPYGAVNSRVFDALACGTVVATNCESGVRELFDDEFPTWSDQASMRAALDSLLDDEPRRAALADRYGRLVREHHTYERRAARLTELLEGLESRLSFCIKTGAPNRAVAAEWGDVHFGESLARELRRRGHRAIVQVLDEWENRGALRYDVVIHLKGLSRYDPKPGQFNVLWCISHPDELTVKECERYDLVCVASPRFAAELRPRVEKPVIVLEQATDTWLFHPDPDPRYGHDLLFVANSRKVMRRIMSDLLPTDHDLAVYGANWQGLIDERYIAGEHIANDELRRAYSSAAIVLNDHWDDMRAHGFVSNRIYDALACGALVLSDHLPELPERFGDAVVTYSDPEKLPELIGHLLRSPEERAERGRRGREAVLASYTFAHRADELLAAVHEHASETRLINEAPPPAPAGRVRRRRRARKLAGAAA